MRAGQRHGACGARQLAAALVLLATTLAAASAWACGEGVHLKRPVELSEAERSAIVARAPLTVLALQAPPMTRRDADAAQGYSGVGMDAWCFIARQVGLHYRVEADRGDTVAQKIARVQAGQADALLSLSPEPQRAALGLFTLPYFESNYAVIGRKSARLLIHGMSDLAQLRVGLVKGVAFEPVLQAFMPPEQLVLFDQNDSRGLFAALREGAIDVAVYPKAIFAEKRYELEYFDLEVVHTLRSLPRRYGFYFSPSTDNELLVRVFDRYLQAMDLSDSINLHEDAEQQFIERYVAQRSQRTYWRAGAVLAGLLAIVFFVVLRRYRYLMRQLAERNQRILQQQRVLAASHRRLQQLSQTDGLTGLTNRREFDHALAREHERRSRSGAPLSVIMMDIDHFKCVNDHYGHAVGDDYLRAVARVLRQSVLRPADIAARYGGEEFVCLLPDTGAQEARQVAERIRENLRTLQLPNASAPRPVLTLSFGIATLIDGPAGAAQLLERADAELYAAKRAGRDRVHGSELRA